MENWTSDFDRQIWNESDPNLQYSSPLFVPKHNWTEADFDEARSNPKFQTPEIQKMIEYEYERLAGIPHHHKDYDPWEGYYGEAGCGDGKPGAFDGPGSHDTFAGIPGGSNEHLRSDPIMRSWLIDLSNQVRNHTFFFEPCELVTMAASLQELQVVDFGMEVKQRWPLRSDEFEGPKWRSVEQAHDLAGELTRQLDAFLRYDPHDIATEQEVPSDLLASDSNESSVEFNMEDTVYKRRPASESDSGEWRNELLQMKEMLEEDSRSDMANFVESDEEGGTEEERKMVQDIHKDRNLERKERREAQGALDDSE